jgi:hypothetical protein
MAVAIGQSQCSAKVVISNYIVSHFVLVRFPCLWVRIEEYTGCDYHEEAFTYRCEWK